MKKYEFTKLQELLPKAIHHYNLDRQVKGASVCHHFRTIAANLWDESVSESVNAASFKDGVVSVMACDSGWAQQIQFKRTQLLEQLREQCPNITIKDLRIRVKKF